MTHQVKRLLRTRKRAIERARHDVEVTFPRLLERIQRLVRLDRKDWRVLDLGCGYTYPTVALLANQDVSAAGVDLVPAFFRDGLIEAWRSSSASLPRRLWRTITDHYYGQLYFETMSQLIGSRIDHARLDLQLYDGERLPFDDGTFNIVVSNAVLEHVSDLSALASEVNRVLAPDGAFDMLWHNFYSFSGNHLPEEANDAAPWGHLRGLLTPPADSGLNRALPEEVLGAFSEVADEVSCIGADRQHRLEGDPRFQREREDLLVGQLREELTRQYPEELLLTRAYIIQGRRAEHGSRNPNPISDESGRLEV